MKEHLVLEWYHKNHPTVKARIYTASGVLISDYLITEKRTQINVQALPSGLYFLELQDIDNGDGIVRKIVVN